MRRSVVERFEGNVTSPLGFKACGIHAGLKKVKKDMAFIVSDVPCVTAAAFTTNSVKAAPVLWDMKVRDKGVARAVVVNSGNANACTGEQGLKDSAATAAKAASLIGCQADEVYVASTGVIGVPLDMDKVLGGVDKLFPLLSADGGWDASDAILTTDTVRKTSAVQLEIAGRTVRIAGMAKGSGMIHPNMATMLCFITSDAAISKEALSKLLGDGIADTFNMISVDGDTSTNDSVFVLANGLAGNALIEEGGEDYKAFKEAFDTVLGDLAKAIVKDGEGAGRFIEMRVHGASSKESARAMARGVISSSLVKAAFFGADANWGRILCAMGYSDKSLDSSLVDLSFSSPAGSIEVLKAGQPIAFDEAVAKKVLLEKEVGIDAWCNQGSYEATAWGCDLTYDYVRINGDYRS